MMRCERRGAAALLAVVCVTLSTSTFGESATGVSGPIRVDSTGGEVRLVCPADVSYGTGWGSLTNLVGAQAVIRKVTRPDTEVAVTSLVTTCATDMAGVFQYVAASGESCRLLLTSEIDGVAVGETLAADVVVGCRSAASSPIFAASGDALQRLAEAKAVVPLAYSTAWTNGVKAVQIDYSYERTKRGQFVDGGSGTIGRVAADATGAFQYDLGGPAGFGGDYTLTCTLYGSGDEVLDTYTAMFSLPVKLGMKLIIR